MARKKKKRGKTRATNPRADTGDKTAPISRDEGSGALAWLRRNADLAAAAATVIAYLFHIFTTTDPFVGSGTDMISNELPLHTFATDWMSRGVLPLWNPFVFCGVPFQAGVHGYLYPGWWTGLLLPIALDIKVGILIHLVLAITGAVWFARGRVRSRIASYLAGVTFALSGFTAMHLFAGHRVMIATFAYLPWIAGSLDRAIRSSWRPYLALAASMCGLMLLCGHYHVVFIGLGGLLAFLVLERALGPLEESRNARRRLGETAKAFGFWACASTAGALIAAVHLVPMMGTIELSQRSGGDASFSASFSSAPPNLLTYLLPNLFGNKIEVPFVGDWSYWESLGYLGLVPTVLVILAVVVLPWRHSVPALAVSVAALILAMGAHTPVFDLYLIVVPGADLFRSPGRFCLLPALLVALLSARALDTWLAGEIPPGRRRLVFAAVWLIPLVAVAAMIYMQTLDPGQLGEAVRKLTGSRAASSTSDATWRSLLDLARSDSFKAAAVTTVTGIALTLGLVRPAGAAPLGIVLALVAAMDLHHFGHRFLRTMPLEHLALPGEIAEIMREEGGEGVRFLAPPTTRWHNYGAIHGLGNPGGYDSFIDGRYARYINRSRGRALDRFFGYEKTRRMTPLLRLLGPRYLLTKEPLRGGRNRQLRGYDRFELHKRFGSTYLYQDPDAPPRSTLAHKIEVVRDEEEIYRRMERSDFELSELALVEEELPADFPPPEPSRPGAIERAEILRLEPNRVEVAVEASSRAVLVMSDTLHPGWSARVDGEPAPMIHANRVMRAVPVPAGEHTVKMTYLPSSFIVGAALSVFSIASWILVMMALRRRERKLAG